MRFLDREDAGRQLARQVRAMDLEDPLVLGLPRGGVPVAYEVATAIGAPLDVWVVRKVGAPDFPELGLGAVSEGGAVYLNRPLISEVGASRTEVEEIVDRERAEVERRARRFRGDRGPPEVVGRNVVLIDDGIATGGTVRAAVQALRAAGPRSIVLAVPVAATQSLAELRPLVDAVVCVAPTPALHAIGAWYDDFTQVPDEEVIDVLERAREPKRAASRTNGRARNHGGSLEVEIPLERGALSGTLTFPPNPVGLVLFAHGSGSSRFSPRNRFVASVLQRFGVATLLFDLLTREEEVLDERTGALRFDIGLLAERLDQATEWALSSPETRGLPLGYFGSSTGAAAALVAAAERGTEISAVVSRGGRPDLAGDSLALVLSPTLLIVGGADTEVLALNEAAREQLRATSKLVVVPGATHLFEEPGALDAVARLAGEWFQRHLGAAAGLEAPMEPEAPPPG